MNDSILGPAQASSPTAAQANNINKTLSQIYTALTTLFVGKASTGTFALSAAATKTVLDANVVATSVIVWMPTDASAGTLEGSAKKLYVSAIVPQTSFTVATASGGNAAGGETFSYCVITVA